MLAISSLHFKQKIEFPTGPIRIIHLTFTLETDSSGGPSPSILPSGEQPDLYSTNKYRLQACVDVDGCIPISIVDIVGAGAASWSRGLDFILEDGLVLRAQLHHDLSLYRSDQLGRVLAHVRVMSGSPKGEVPLKESTGTFQVSEGVVAFSAVSSSDVIPPDDEVYIFADEYEAQTTVDPAVRGIWSSCPIEQGMNLQKSDSWDLHYLLDLVDLSLTRAKEYGSPEVQDAEDYALKALGLCPSPHPHRFISLAAIGKARMTHYEFDGATKKLDDAFTYHREALELCPQDFPHREMFLTRIASASLGRFRRLREREYLDQSLRYYGDALALCPPDHDFRAVALHNLATASLVLFSANADIVDLVRSIVLYNEALDIRVPGHPDRPVTLFGVADAYSQWFDRTGELSDLDHAILYCHEALTLQPPSRPEDAPRLTSLATACIRRYIHRGDMKDLDRAVKFQQDALQLYRDGPNARSAALDNLGGMLLMRYRYKGDAEDLEQAIKNHSQALMFHPRGHPDRQGTFSNLGSAYVTRFELKNEVGDLERGVRYHEEALKLCPSEEHPGNGPYLYNAANVLLSRFAQLHDPPDLDLAAAHLRNATSLLSPDDPTLGLVHLASAREHLMRYALFRNQTDCDEAFQLYEKAAHHSASGTRQQLIAAVRWASLAEENRHVSSLVAYTRSLHLLDRQVSVGRDVSSRRTLRTGVSLTIASDAAACAVDEGQCELAVELLDQGRGLLWAQLIRYRTSLDDLRRLGNEETTLADEFDQLSKLLESGAISKDTPWAYERGQEKENQRYREIAEKWEATLARIRKVSGFSHFLKPTPYTSLQQAARFGPVIIVNISERRSDAIVIHCVGSPRIIPLPHATPTSTSKLSLNLFNSVRNNRSQECESNIANQAGEITRHVRVQRKAQEDDDAVLARILAELWDSIVCPVLDSLQLRAQLHSTPPRLFWCPTGPLSSLPIHAAGKAGTNAMDFVASSYLTTLSSQIRVSKETFDSPRILLIAQPNTPGASALPMVNAELAVIQRVVEGYGGAAVNILSGQDATIQTVGRALEDSHWVHFMCHGVQDGLNSRFLLYDGALSLQSVMHQMVQDAQFAFLSACQTASGDAQTPDEAIHLAAGLLFAGFRSVVATLWSINDDDGPRVAGAFYEMLGESGELRGGDAAIALHASVQALRSRGVQPTRWVPFIHLGF
ncbi:hypothetical protein JAAARDRAFT_181029 [Jaapia argillacea MUCL 33604]|uniref:CHAT domain-containing protein n=1 Tax=Jaapia argillacea MUCL 33604 TaxID=933084 RepID=A0A067PMI5_9AGAM|nr:hypothetical protein JAAARDRAFT_181029 [Jaapia argillacea MUCL 33604]